MTKKFTNLFCIFTTVLISIVFTPSLLSAQEREMGGDIRETVIELQRLIRDKQAEGVDVTEALKFDKKSREAMRENRPDECLRLLREAIALLEGASGERSKGEMEGATVRNVYTKYENSPFGYNRPEVRGEIMDPYRYAKDIGIKWARSGYPVFWFVVQPDISVKRYDWSRYDMTVRAASEIILVPNISPGLGDKFPPGLKSTQNIKQQTKYMRLGSFLPADERQYTDFVKAFVERYDGDGIDDMPGLKTPIKCWQVDNEPPHGLKDYAELMKITYQAIKSADSQARVIIGGVPGMPSGYLDFFKQKYSPILRELRGKYVDIFDFHWYGNATGDYKKIEKVYNYIREILNRNGFSEDLEIWVTEMGTYSGDPVPVKFIPGYDPPLQTERQQAIDLVKRYVYSLSVGIKKIFLAGGIMEGFKNDDGYFDHAGIIYDGKFAYDKGRGVKKLAYYTYKKMVEKLEGSDWDNIQTIQEEDGIYIYKFIKNGKPIWVAWDDKEIKCIKAPCGRQVIISGIDSKQIKITESVPRYESGKDVRDYNTAFKEIKGDIMESYPLQLGFELGKNPVFVEEVYKTVGD